MRLRTPAGERSNAASESESTAAAPSWKRLGGHLLTAVGLLVFTYAVLRVLGPRDDVPVQSVDDVRDEMEGTVPAELRDRAVDAVPDERSIDTIRNRAGATVPDDITGLTIDGPESGASETAPDVEPSGDATEGSAELEGTATNTDAIADDRSDEEVTERASSHVQTDPAEPGEMTVDEGIVDELVDTDAEADNDADADDDTEAEE
ncbi:hypothetical protein [Natrinema altunense]|uniref:Uncharacterized protein n=1 Tax=Natrinema altunense (strain JCM 12890 / CGMCC 1.3731 / AJ2) TaxID=1227494 RepID=L9ZND2_NATA2|nr:hypothetical protein [Natrinema altunense]ELY86673.1 hypothetical protein C485_07142 [Natrinema altunense JCM 12890]